MPQELPLWPDAVPYAFEPDEPERTENPPPAEGMLAPDRHVVAISEPTLTVYRPERPASARSAVLIYPGGGYRLLAIDKEGHHFARWLAGLGMVAVVCKYRTCPESLNQGKGVFPEAIWRAILADGCRALRLLRHMAPELGVDPANVGAMGFSAGGNLCAKVGYGERPAPPVDDAVSRESAELAFIAPIYVAWPGDLAQRVGPGAPPAFFCDASDDETTPPANSIGLYEACLRAGVSAELHLYRQGGHGFGMGPEGSPLQGWTDAYAAWLRDLGMID